jgi:hypothetical protein
MGAETEFKIDKQLGSALKALMNTQFANASFA